jgi:succinate-semialdehyde dehydrogenase / glutarate-semialdehyde dehydrogenase
MLSLNDQSLLKSHAYLNGQWIDADNGKTFDVLNPASGEKITAVASMSAVETRRAIETANAAWIDWRNRTGKERSAILRNWFQLMMENQQDLATILSAEQGKPLVESMGEVAYGASFIEWFAEEAKRIYGDIIPSHGRDKRIVVIKQPIGVVAAVTPWNFPNAMITRKAGPALAVGCPFIIKPAAETPLSALALAVLAERAGVPAGIFSVLPSASASEVGGEMTSNPTVRKITFTGSTAVGKLLMEQSAKTLKKVSLELGGNAPFIVFDDADVDAAVAGALISKYRNSGQTCVCTNRFLVQDSVYDEFVEKLTAGVKKLKVASAFEDGAQQGPLINEAAIEKVEEHLADALAKGGKIVTGGKRHERGGTFFEPTIIADATTEMACATDETFGPVAPIFRFTTEEEAIKMANATEFGLASYFYSRDIGRIWRVAENIESGMVGVNEGLISTEIAPFGGIKESGLGREGSHYGTEDYLEIKYICMGGL